MTSAKYSHHFSLSNLPYGIASSPTHQQQCATRLYNTVIFLDVLQQSGFFNDMPSLPEGVFTNSTLNEYAALPKSIHTTVRSLLQNALGHGLESLPQPAKADISTVTMHLPVSIPAFTDFSTSLNHVQNAGRAILNDPSPPPGFFHFPIGYAGRASTVVVSGTPITRPTGHFYDRTSDISKTVIHGPSRALDYEMELGIIIGKPLPRETGLHAKDAEEHIFGFVVLNDWSARDIQGLEMIPLGPLKGKSFGSTISPWIVTTDALAPFKTAGPEPKVPLPVHLQEETEFNYDIVMRVEILPSESSILEHSTTPSEKETEILDDEKNAYVNANLIATSHAKSLYWSHRQMTAHLTSSGCDLQTGELLGTGTVSGSEGGSYGCLLESTKGGKEAVKLKDGSRRVYLADGDVVRMSAFLGGEEKGVGFGECVGVVRAAVSI
ncbi:hypothetical protein BJX99DRAFT_272861 [Aspergillus californicus]